MNKSLSIVLLLILSACILYNVAENNRLRNALEFSMEQTSDATKDLDKAKRIIESRERQVDKLMSMCIDLAKQRDSLMNK